MDKVLIIGGYSGIGEATIKSLESFDLDCHVPYHDELDVRYRFSTNSFLQENGPFEYIVYSAGVNRLGWIQDISLTEIGDIFDVNVFGFIDIVSCHKALWPQSRVSAVAVSSDAAEIPMRGSLMYCASKAALNMAIRVMARELAPLWRVNGVAPGMVANTPMTNYIDETIPEFRGWTPDQARSYEQNNTPTGRRATKQEVANTIAWVLTGPEQMTGEIVKINGGR